MRTALVVGAGIVGLTVAKALMDGGHAVRLVDPSAPGSGCSSGNSGALSSGSVAPLAMPGLLRSTLPMLLDPAGPLYVPLRYWPRAASWLWQFGRAAQPRRVAAIADALHALLRGSVDHHAALAREVGCAELVRRTGQLHLYPDAQAVGKDAAGWALKQSHGLRLEALDAGAIAELEPAVDNRAYTAGYYLPDEGSVSDPLRYCQAIAAWLRQQGAVFETARIDRLQRLPRGWQASAGERGWSADHVVICAGAWSAELLRTLQIKAPLQTQRGYHLQYPEIDGLLSRVVVLADRKVFINPMLGGLRVGGTVEIDALDEPPHLERARRLEQHLQAGLRVPLKLGQPSSWMGHRPCMPDSMPVIGEVPGRAGLWCAFGHGHLGLTGSVNTARWIADAVAGKPLDAAARHFSVARFA
ncbi:NAD(P)/FAD-dependent oxidoreductase [Xylophilus rhododendri]|nr:FAD-dependent oxidoreductase [Xylophilus rhododendri]